MATYYIKQGGNDSLDGLSDETAWATEFNVNNGSFSPSDSVKVKNDGGVYGKIVMPSSGTLGNWFSIETYGTGEAPKCRAGVLAAGWNDQGGNIHSFQNVAMTEDPKMVRFDGVNKVRGKSGYFTITAASGTEEWVEATGLPTFDYTGVQIVTRNRRFIFRSSGSVSKVGNRLTYGSDMPDLGLYNCIVGYGFFLQNHLSYLTSNGDWMYDSDTDTLYMYFADNNPDAHEVYVATDQHAIDFNGTSHTRVIGVNSELSISHVIRRTNVEYNHVIGCEVSFGGDDGISTPDFASSYCLTNSNVIHDCHSSGLYANYNCHHMEATNNWVYNCGLNAGASLLYGNSDSRGIGICLQLGTGNKANLNRVTNIGFNGIVINGNSFEMDDNIVDTYNLLKDDGSGLYCSLGGTAFQLSAAGSIRRNLVVNGVGNNVGANDPAVVVFGAYMDDTQNLVEIEDNLFANNAGAGIYLHNCNAITVRYNKFIGNARAINFSQDSGLTIRNLIIKHNEIFLNDPNQFIVSCFSEVPEDIALFGDVDENEYNYIENHIGLFEVYGGDKYNYGVSFSEWQTVIAGEALSTCQAFQNHLPDDYVQVSGWSQTYPTDGSQSGSGNGQFSLFSGGTRTWSGGKAIITKTSGGKQDAYMAIGSIASASKYVFTVNVDSAGSQYVSLIPESSFNTSMKRKRIQAPVSPVTYKLLFDDLNADASDQMLWLMESNFTTLNIEESELELIEDFTFESEIELIYNSGTEAEAFTFDTNRRDLSNGIVALEFTLQSGESAILQKTTDPVTPVAPPAENITIAAYISIV